MVFILRVTTGIFFYYDNFKTFQQKVGFIIWERICSFFPASVAIFYWLSQRV